MKAGRKMQLAEFGSEIVAVNVRITREICDDILRIVRLPATNDDSLPTGNARTEQPMRVRERRVT